MARTEASSLSSHLATELFVDVYTRMAANDDRGAHTGSARLETLVSLLFKEANPMPIKYCLWKLGLIGSPECRLPLSPGARAIQVPSSITPCRR